MPSEAQTNVPGAEGIERAGICMAEKAGVPKYSEHWEVLRCEMGLDVCVVDGRRVCFRHNLFDDDGKPYQTSSWHEMCETKKIIEFLQSNIANSEEVKAPPTGRSRDEHPF